MKTVLINGKIYVERGVFKSAAAMENGIITAVGTDEEILDGVGRDARIIDCCGRTVIPGLNDSHMHLLMMGARKGIHEGASRALPRSDTRRWLEPGYV